MKKPIDELWRETLEYLEVPKSPGLFVLGSFARRVTVYSQQVRALSMVDALAGMGYLHKSSSVAVVGAGFAGLTTAAALAKMGASVSLFDVQTAPMHLQLNCATRYIHPNIYEWPLTNINDDDAKLPLLNWKAQYARELANQIQRSWEEIREGALPGKVEEHLGKKITGVIPEQDRWRLEVANESHSKLFDIVVLAVGFGVEEDNPFSYSYWGDIPLTEAATHAHKWMISGAGDGALTDVIRLCIRNCDHEKALRNIIAAVEEHAGAAFLDQLKDRIKSGVTGQVLFENLKPEPIAAKLDLRETPVVLNATLDSIFGTAEKPPNSSTLNRLATWVMWKSGKITFVNGVIKNKPVSGQRGAFKVKLVNGNDPLVECQELLLRHGPIPAISPKSEEANVLKGHWLVKTHLQELKRLQRRWEKLYDNQAINQRWIDPTLLREWSNDDFGSERLSADVMQQPAALLYCGHVVGGEDEERTLTYTVEAVLRRPAIRTQIKEATGTACPKRPILICLRVEDAVKTPRSFGAVLQTLCRVPVLIVDGSDVTPAMAFLLGLRSAVRRGVTLLFRIGSMNFEAWQRLAFNLRGLRIVEVPGRANQAAETPLATALEEGLRRYARRPSQYADLPGFDAIRNLGAHEDDASIRTPDEEILVLCPFDADYEEKLWPQIQRALTERFCPDTNASPGRRVIDLKSPETLERRLFESIRRDADCIVDLTRRKPNVFFELGFRLGVNPRGARIIRCVDFQNQAEPHECSVDIEALFGAKPYNFKMDPVASISAAACLDTDIWPGGNLSASYAFFLAQRCVCPEQEGGGIKILDLLWQAVESVGGKDRQRQAVYPALYIDNQKIRAQTVRFLFDGILGYLLLAAKILPNSDRSKRTIAIAELRGLLNELKLDDAEKKRLSVLITQLENNYES